MWQGYPSPLPPPKAEGQGLSGRSPCLALIPHFAPLPLLVLRRWRLQILSLRAYLGPATLNWDLDVSCWGLPTEGRAAVAKGIWPVYANTEPSRHLLWAILAGVAGPEGK